MKPSEMDAETALDRDSAARVWRELDMALRAAERWWPTESTLRCGTSQLTRVVRLAVRAFKGEIWIPMECANWRDFVTHDLQVTKPWNAVQRAQLSRQLMNSTNMTVDDVAAFVQSTVDEVRQDLGTEQ